MDRDSFVLLCCIAAVIGACGFEEPREKVLAWDKPNKGLAERAAQCGRRYLVVNLDGTLRCASLVPGIAWQPYPTAEDEERARTEYLKRLKRK
jgi:hypothetical protein